MQDADVPTSKLRELYTVLVQDVRIMFQVCRLVHADLSEYNILYFAGRLAIIDVSQARARLRYIVGRVPLNALRRAARSRWTWTTRAASIS